MFVHVAGLLTFVACVYYHWLLTPQYGGGTNVGIIMLLSLFRYMKKKFFDVVLLDKRVFSDNSLICLA